MTPDAFRALALALPGAAESSHMGHPDFRVGGKVFATLGYPRAGFAMVALTPEEQAAFVALRPQTFAPAAGAWGRGGATTVDLGTATKAVVRAALEAAWRARSHRPGGGRMKTAPRRRRP